MSDLLALPSKLTHREARDTLVKLLQRWRAQTEAHWVVDASALQVFDSSALAVMLECRRKALAEHKTFAVRGLPVALAGLAALYGVAELLPSA